MTLRTLEKLETLLRPLRGGYDRLVVVVRRLYVVVFASVEVFLSGSQQKAIWNPRKVVRKQFSRCGVVDGRRQEYVSRLYIQIYASLETEKSSCECHPFDCSTQFVRHLLGSSLLSKNLRRLEPHLLHQLLHLLHRYLSHQPSHALLNDRLFADCTE